MKEEVVYQWYVAYTSANLLVIFLKIPKSVKNNLTSFCLKLVGGGGEKGVFASEVKKT